MNQILLTMTITEILSWVMNSLIWVVPSAILAIIIGYVLSLRRIVPTNVVHIVQRGDKTVSYGVGKGSNVYYEFPKWLPKIGVEVRVLPVSNFDIDLQKYSAYDLWSVPKQRGALAGRGTLLITLRDRMLTETSAGSGFRAYIRSMKHHVMQIIAALFAVGISATACQKDDKEEPAPEPVVVAPSYSAEVQSYRLAGQVVEVYLNGTAVSPWTNTSSYYLASVYPMKAGDTLLVRSRLAAMPIPADSGAVRVRISEVTELRVTDYSYARDTAWTVRQWVMPVQ